MGWNFEEALNFFASGGADKFLPRCRHGLEKECLRVDSNGCLAQTPHPASLGKAMTHRYISLDYSESQMEFITAPYTSIDGLMRELRYLLAFSVRKLKGEEMWVNSMPSILPQDELDVPLANFGSSDAAREKAVYRNGLGLRYGRKMQTISGVHYNFSFSEGFWKEFHEALGDRKQNWMDFRSDAYLHMARNFLRWGWLNTYLFGATPAIDQSYVNGEDWDLEQWDATTAFLPYATSLRMSDLGYFSKVQQQVAISYNSIQEYARDLCRAMTTREPKYTDIGIGNWQDPKQLNDNIIQNEHEHYTHVRPKQLMKADETPLEAILSRGVHYVETRCVDLDPWAPLGVSRDQVEFLYLYLLYCLCEPGPVLCHKESQSLLENQHRVARFGRQPGLKVHGLFREELLKDYGLSLLDSMKPLAECVAKTQPRLDVLGMLKRQEDKLRDPEQTPSAKILQEMKSSGESFSKVFMRLSRERGEYLRQLKLPKAFEEKMAAEKQLSEKTQEDLEIRSEFILKGFEDMELSTQLVIREALCRGVKVEVLDRRSNFIRLRQGDHVECIKEANKTSRDSYVTALLMENKVVSKQLLQESGVSVPLGGHFDLKEEALQAYEGFQHKKVVVKPVSTNYGIGISFVEPGDMDYYRQALDLAFQHDKQVIVEEFCQGEEYRFLVIGDRVEGIVKRIPANVVGDGEKTVQQLVNEKNRNPRSYKVPKMYIRLGKEEKECLARAGLSKDSVLESGRRFFLRENSNVSTGGDAIEMFDQVHSSYSEIAVQAARAAGAQFCGVDMLIVDPAQESSDVNYSIVEINFNPVLYFHRFPSEGKGRRVEKATLDFLGFTSVDSLKERNRNLEHSYGVF